MSSRTRDAAAVRFPPPFLYAISIALGVMAHRFVHPWPLPDLEGISWTISSLTVTLAGIGLVVAAFRHFRRTGQDPEPWKPTPSILTEGIYRYTRNPMYVGLALIQTGIGLGAGSLWIVAATPLSLVAVYLVAVRPEEAYLEQKFGDEYRRYKANVRRWI